jgi:hypothetical protein
MLCTVLRHFKGNEQLGNSSIVVIDLPYIE